MTPTAVVMPEPETPQAVEPSSGGYAIEMCLDGQVIRYEGPTAEGVVRLMNLADQKDKPTT